MISHLEQTDSQIGIINRSRKGYRKCSVDETIWGLLHLSIFIWQIVKKDPIKIREALWK